MKWFGMVIQIVLLKIVTYSPLNFFHEIVSQERLKYLQRWMKDINGYFRGRNKEEKM